MDSIERYRHKVFHALAGFQLLEETIKNYIEAYHGLVKSCVPNNLTYKFSRETVEALPLSKLSSYLSKIVDNDDLIKRINLLPVIRNALAHKALLKVYKEGISESEYESEVQDYISITDEVSELVEVIQIEIDSLQNIMHSKIERNEALENILSKLIPSQ